MKLKTTLLGKTYQFSSVKEVLAKANEEKSGDKLAGLAAASAQERVAAKVVLSALTLKDLRENPVVPYEQDEVTRIIQDDVNEAVYRQIQNWTVAELREYILSEETSALRRLSRGLTSEMVAAVCPAHSAAVCSQTTPPMTPTASPLPCWRDFPSAQAMRSSV